MDQKVTLIDKKSHQGIEVNASDKIQLSAQSPSVVQLKISSEDIKESLYTTKIDNSLK